MKKLLPLALLAALCVTGCSVQQPKKPKQQPKKKPDTVSYQWQSQEAQQQELDMLSRSYEIDLQTENPK